MKLLVASLLVGSLSGCIGARENNAVEAAVKPTDEHRFVMHGTPDKGALLLDSETGRVWRYEGSQLVLVPVAEVHNTDKGAITITRDAQGKIVKVE